MAISDVISTTGTEIKTQSPLFVCVISYTSTCEIPGLTAAGAGPELFKYTPPADAEFLYHGRCRCIDGIPATPDGKPSPAILTRSALNLARIPALVVNAGSRIRPSIPYIDFSLAPGANIALGPAMTTDQVHQAMEYGRVLGKQLAQSTDLLVIGESIPGGTTTALAVLCALGIDARFKISSSMPNNPHSLKNSIVDSALARIGNAALSSATEAVSLCGDPMMASVSGIAAGGLDAGTSVMLAGGTQMAAVLALTKQVANGIDNLSIGTTKYVLDDPCSSLLELRGAIAPSVPVFACDLHLDESSKPGLQAFAQGFVKEGVGAGGACIASIAKSRGRLDGHDLLKEIEREYVEHIEVLRGA